MRWNQVNASEAFKINFPKWFNSDTRFSQVDCNLRTTSVESFSFVEWMKSLFVEWLESRTMFLFHFLSLSLSVPFCDLCFVYIFTSFDRWWEAITQRCFMNVVWDVIFPCAASSSNYKRNSATLKIISAIAHRTQSNYYWPEYTNY